MISLVLLFNALKKFFFLNLCNGRLVTANKSTYKQTLHPLRQNLFRRASGVVCELKCVTEESPASLPDFSLPVSVSRLVKASYRTSSNVKIDQSSGE